MRSIQVRLHPKPQLEVQYRVNDALKLFGELIDRMEKLAAEI